MRVTPMAKNNYDYTADVRRKRRKDRIVDSGLYKGEVVMLRKTRAKVVAYAKKLYEAEGFELLPPE